jgi:hypothetical protein
VSDMKPSPTSTPTGAPAVPLSAVGQPGGVASLGSDGKVPAGQINSAAYVTAFLPAAYGAKGDYDPVAQTGTDDTTALQNCVNAAAAVHGRVVLSQGYYKISDDLVVPDGVTIEGVGCHTLNGTKTLHGYWSMGFPQIEPFLAGSVIVQTVAGKNGLRVTASGKSVNMSGFGVLFDKSIRYTNTGHGIYCIPPTYSTNYDNGITNATWDNIAVYGHDGNHYGIWQINPIYNTWGQVQTFGGGGLYINNNVPDNHDYGNLALAHGFFVTFLAGSADVIKLQNTNVGTQNLYHFGRVQGVTWNVGTLTDGYVTTPPTSAQQLLNCDPFVTYLAITAPDFETSVSSPITLPTHGNVWLGPGGAVPGSTSRLYQTGDANVPNRALYTDLSARLSTSEAAGGLVGPAATAVRQADRCGNRRHRPGLRVRRFRARVR